MNRRNRLATTSLAALLALGGTTAATVVSASAQTTDPTPTTTVVSDPSAPVTVTVTVHLPLIGDVTMTVDTATGTVSDVVVAPIDGVTTATPVVDGHDVRIDVVLADGTSTTVVLETHTRDGAVTVEVEDDEGTDDHAHAAEHTGPPAIADRGESADHRQDDQGHQGRGEGVPSTTAPSSQNTSASHGGGHGDSHDDDR